MCYKPLPLGLRTSDYVRWARSVFVLESGIVFISMYVCSLCTWYVILQYNVNLADAYTANGLWDQAHDATEVPA